MTRSQEWEESPSGAVQRLVGKVLAGRFKVLEQLAVGGMGTVYVAEQRSLGRRVALKVLKPPRGDEQDLRFQERFLLEAAAVARLRHPNTVVLHDFGTTDEEGFAFYAMELIEGSTLFRRVVTGGPLSARETAHVGRQVAGSLQEAHDAGLVHRDLKPSNVMLTRRGKDELYVKVLDFGLVKDIDGGGDRSQLTQSGLVMGSPRYMAPEQVRGFEVDHRADIYALGSVLYFALAGRPPFELPSQFDILRAQVEQVPPPLHVAHPGADLDPQLEAAILRCLEKNPEARFPSMDALSEALGGILDAAGPSGEFSSRRLHTGPLTEEPAIQNSEGARPRPEPPPPKRAPESSDTRPTGPRPRSGAFRKVAGEAAPPRVPANEAPSAAPLEAPPPRRSPLLAVVVVLAVLLAAAGAFALRGMLPGPPAREATASPPAPTAPAPALEPALTPVQIRSEPPGAHVFHDGEDLGDTPVTVMLPARQRTQLTLRRPGFQERTVRITAGQGLGAVSHPAVATADAPERAAPVRARRSGPTPDAPAPAPSPTRRRPRTDNRNPWE